MDEIKQENIVRIKDKKLLERLNKMYAERKGVVYTSKNNFLNDILQVGIQTYEKQEKDNWAIQHEKQTLLDAIHAHTWTILSNSASHSLNLPMQTVR